MEINCMSHTSVSNLLCLNNLCWCLGLQTIQRNLRLHFKELHWLVLSQVLQKKFEVRLNLKLSEIHQIVRRKTVRRICFGKMHVIIVTHWLQILISMKVSGGIPAQLFIVLHIICGHQRFRTLISLSSAVIYLSYLPPLPPFKVNC